jgi:hypothetical protein
MTKIDRRACFEPCATEGGNLVGRDPRQMGRIELEAAGFERASPMELIRAKCLDCCAGHAQEVRYCVATSCPLWPYRMSSNPFRAPLSEEVRTARAASLAKARAPRSNPVKLQGSDEAMGVGCMEMAPAGSPSSKASKFTAVASGEGQP